MNIVSKTCTHLDLAAGSEAPTHFWENRSLPPFGAVTLRSCKPFGIILAFKPLQGPLVPVSAKDNKVTTPRNEVAPPPGVSAGAGVSENKVPCRCPDQ